MYLVFEKEKKHFVYDLTVMPYKKPPLMLLQNETLFIVSKIT